MVDVMAGRPTTYTEAIGDEICARVAAGENIYRICQDGDFAERTVYQWLKAQEVFAQNYARARELRADKRSDRIDDIVAKVLTGEYDAAAARVAIDAEKWQAGKENPKRYGDKVTNEHTGSVTHKHKTITRRVLKHDKSE